MDISNDIEIDSGMKVTFNPISTSIFLNSGLKPSALLCLKNDPSNSPTYFIIESYKDEKKDLDPQLLLTVNSVVNYNLNSASSRIDLDVTYTPCLDEKDCQEPEKQIKAIYKTLSSDFPDFTLWLDITLDGWGTDFKTNKNAFNNIKKITKNLGCRFGVRADYKSWISIFGDKFSPDPSIALWFTDEEDKFQSFGAWSSPMMYKPNDSQDTAKTDSCNYDGQRYFFPTL